MSLAAFVLIIVYVVVLGIPNPRPKDEGAAAHIFQLLIAGQIPIIAYFTFKWLPKKSTQTLQILALQFISGAAAFFLVFFFEL